MATKFHLRVRQILEKALQLEPHAREPFIRQACAGDPHLCEEVCSLLPHYESVDDFEPPPPHGSAWKFPGTTAFTQARADAADADSPEPEPAPPFSIGRYTAVEVLGHGGMGVVYRALHPTLQHVVAVKILRKGLLSDEHRQRFTFEAQVLRQLRHPGIGRILHAGVDRIVPGDTIPATYETRPYFVMEYICGKPLTTFAAENRLDLRQRLSLFIAVCDAVEYAHHRGIIHCDLKPDNILVEGSGQPKILDFGIAHILGFQSPPYREVDGQFTGTLEYASPEQIAGKITQLTPGSDVFALGLIGYELLTGTSPRGADGRLRLRGLRLTDTSSPQSAPQEEFSRRLTAIFATALRAAKGATYTSAGQLGADIERLLARYSVRSRWSLLKSRLGRLVAPQPERRSDPASRPLAAVLRQRIAMAIESETYRSSTSDESPDSESA